MRHRVRRQSDPCGALWDRMSLAYGRAVDRPLQPHTAYITAREQLERCLEENGQRDIDDQRAEGGA